MVYKLVIWDLDETFWKGTLSEGAVEPIEDNISIVKKLVDRGIMNSIVSKNDLSDVMNVLDKWEISQYFIFPSISWEPKGKRVNELLKDCGLRAENTLFVDDNESNLAEVEYYNPGITCVLPSFFQENNIFSLENFKGKDDKSHSRLKQYHDLEKRIEKKKEFLSNEEFLRTSDIKISIVKDCQKEIDRIAELIQRTNQLNYTKNRMKIDELCEIISDKNVEAAYIKAKDIFCDYGIVGFYLIKENKLIHFLFSCRILGLGIENYIYQKLGYPDIETVGEVATALKKDVLVDYITEVNDLSKTEGEDAVDCTKHHLLMIGGCDLESASKYLRTDFEVDKEFNTVIDGHEIRTSDTSQLIYAKELDKILQDELCDKLPFMNASITYATKLYSGKYRVIVISLVDDYIRGVYQKKDGDYHVTWGNYWANEEELESHFSNAELRFLRENFTFVGRESVELFKNNIEKIIVSVGDNCRLLFINGADIDVSDWIGFDRIQRNIEMNAAIDQVLQKYPNVGLVDMRKIVLSRNQLPLKDNRHYDRQTYYKMALEIVRLSEGHINENIKLGSVRGVIIKEFMGKVRRKLNKWKRIFHI